MPGRERSGNPRTGLPHPAHATRRKALLLLLLLLLLLAPRPRALPKTPAAGRKGEARTTGRTEQQ